MKQLCKVEFKNWFIDKMQSWEAAASVNVEYFYEIERETEKAVCFKVFKKESAFDKSFKMWVPKSAIESEY